MHLQVTSGIIQWGFNIAPCQGWIQIILITKCVGGVVAGGMHDKTSTPLEENFLIGFTQLEIV